MNSGLMIAIDSTVHPSAEKLFSSLGKVIVADLATDIPKEAGIAVIRTRVKIDKAKIEALSKLKIIATATSGTDHIDVAWAAKKGIKVINAAGANADSVADYVFRMMLSATDDTVYTAEKLKENGHFEEIKKENTRHDIGSYSIGIVGLGAIGKSVKKRAEAFGMDVKAYDPYNNEARDTLETAMKCDFAVLCAPLNNNTAGMIGKEQLGMMKNGATLVNISRAELVDDDSLSDALKSRRIRAILDVFRNEPKISPFYKLPNATCTPHVAGNSEEAKEKAVRKLYEEVMLHAARQI